MATLGILITSDRYLAYACSIARAAHDKGHAVRIHISGPGVCIAGSGALASLRAWARITACRRSAGKMGLTDDIQRQDPRMLTDDTALAEVIMGCDRHLVL